MMYISLFPLVEPAYFSTIGSIHSLYRYGMYFILAIFTGLEINKYIIKKHLSEIHKTFLMTLVFSIYMLFSTLLAGNTLLMYERYIVPSVSLCLWIDYYGKQSLLNTLKVLCSILDLYIIINFATVIGMPNGLYSSVTQNGSDYFCWFLGYKNPQIRFFIPAIAFGLVYDYIRRGKLTLRSIIRIVLIIVTESKLDSSTSLVGLIIFVICYVLWRKYKGKIQNFRLLQLKYFVVLTIAVSVAIIFFNIQDNFSNILQNVFHRDNTLTDRVFIWELALLALARRCWWGYGLQDAVGSNSVIHATHCHNYYLQQVYTGGIVGFVLCMIMWLVASNEGNKNIRLMPVKVILFALISMLFMGITESLTEAPLLYPLLCLYGMSDIINENEKMKNID